MKRIATFVFILIMASFRSGAQGNDFPRITFGVEWSCIGTFLSGYHNNYFSKDGYRFNESALSASPHINGEALIHAGYNINECWNLSLLTGIMGMADIHNAVPISFRATKYFSSNPLEDRWFAFAEAGTGFGIKREIQEILTGRLGAGYRISLSSISKLDLHASLRCHYGHGQIYHDGSMVKLDRTKANDAFVTALSLGISLVF